MRAHLVDDPADFLAATADFRAADPLLTNVIGSVAASVRDGRTYDSYGWWVVRDDAGSVVGCAVHTAPWPLALSPMPLAAATALGSAVAAHSPVPTAAIGQPDVVAAVLDALAPGAPRTTVMTDVLHVLGSFVPPPVVPGSARIAGRDDLDLLERWHLAFAHDAGMPAVGVREGVISRLDIGALWLWEVDGEPVAMAGHAPLVPTPAGPVGRVGPVYTPDLLRRRGFGAAITAVVVESLVPRCAAVMLYADAANATSNGVYERLGFREQARMVEVALR